MYLHKARIQNIRSFDDFTISFDEGQEAGWHVIIGDNGSGKSTLVKCIATVLIGPMALSLREPFQLWLREKSGKGIISLDIIERYVFNHKSNQDFCRMTESIPLSFEIDTVNGSPMFWGILNDNWFSASFGPYRRFSGGSRESEKLYNLHQRLSSHLTAFGEDVALTECLTWLREIYIKKIDHKLTDDYLEELKTFINESGLLPHNTKLYKVDSEAVYFQDGDGCILPVIDLSDGYRSILSMIFEIIRQMILCYGSEKVFRNIRNNVMNIDLPGVILIDEVDAHLHPSWQERIGSWFTNYFPKVQFIVTTHSPLICRAAETGSVWKLSAPGSDEPSRRITGIELQRLIYGNILEALDTDLFGEDVTRSQSSQRKLERIAQLNRKMLQGKLSNAEKKELDDLRAILPTSTDAGLSTK